MTNSEQLTVALIACSARKLPRLAPARDLYTGTLFRAARAWVEAEGWAWHILSALHGLVDPGRALEPYNVRFQGAAPPEWVDAVWADLLARYAGQPVRFEFLAGRAYHDRLVLRVQGYPSWHASEPLAGLGIGKQIAWLQSRLGE
ncbi:MAG: hypothetical protein GY824_20925 [Delftia sp.]|nr:hypothetical protein [Delftia sp.]